MTLALNPRNLPLRTQLIACFALLGVLVTMIVTVAMTALGSHHMRTSLTEKSVFYARLLQEQLQPVVAFNDELTAREIFSSLGADPAIDGLGVYDASGTLIEGHGAYPKRLAKVHPSALADSGHVIALADVRAPEGAVGHLYLSLTTRFIDAEQRRATLTALGIAIIAFLGALALGFFIARGVTRRLAGITVVARRITAGDLSPPNLPDAIDDEIGALAHAFNVMVSELQRLFEDRRQRMHTERARLEQLVTARTQELEVSRREFSLIYDSANAVPLALNLTLGTLPTFGRGAPALFGCTPSECASEGFLERVVSRHDNSQMRQQFDECSPGPHDFVTPFTRADGRQTELRWVVNCDLAGDVKMLRGVVRDITEERRRGRERAQTQKLESVGRLAAGVAHEINTPVQFVADSVHFVRGALTDFANVVTAYRALGAAVDGAAQAQDELMAARAAETAADLEYLLANAPDALDRAQEGLGRIASTVRAMKEFAYPDAQEKSLVDLNQSIRSTAIIAKHEYKYVAELTTELGDLPLVLCHGGEINQVILNLIINAAHAIAAAHPGGETQGSISIRTRQNAETVEIAIADTGTGIAVEARDKVFDPFFTTKEVGKGTGQGLSIARTVIVDKHGGTIHFDTELGVGTTFYLRLPLANLPLPSQVAAVAA